MKSLLRLDRIKGLQFSERTISYESTLRIPSTAVPGVQFTIWRVSFRRRQDLYRRIRELSGRMAFLESGSDLQERVEANLLAQEIDEMYLRWGLASIELLSTDGEPSTVESLIEKGPESLAREIVRAIKAECGLSNEERKN